MSPVAKIVTDAATTLVHRALCQQFPGRQLSEIIMINNGQGLKAENRDSAGKFDVYGSGGLVGRHSEVMHQGSFVVIGRKGSAGKVTFAPRGGWVTDTAYFATPLQPRELQCKFLFYSLKALDFGADIIATAIPGINRTAIYRHSIPLPPFEVQKSVVEFLDAIADGRSGEALPPLPHLLAQQRAKVMRIEELADQIYQARALYAEIKDDLTAMLRAAHHKIADGAPRKPLSEVAPLRRRPVTVELDKIYQQVAVRSFGRGTFHKPPLHGSEVTWQKPFLVEAGDILVSNIKAWEGALAVATPDDHGRVGSHRYLTFVPVEGMATAQFLCFYLLTPEGLYAVGEASPGSADRNRTLSAKAFTKIQVPVPAYEKQTWFDSLCAEVDALKRLQTETATELDAMLPAILDRAFKGEL